MKKNQINKVEEQASVQHIFPTPILQRQFTDTEKLNRDLKKILLDKEQQQSDRNTGGAQKSNVAGWRSSEDLLEWPHPCIQELTQRVSQAVGALMQSGPQHKGNRSGKMRLYAWANINRRGAYNTAHSHPNNHWAAVYYVCVGQANPDKPLSGNLEFLDPRPAAGFIAIPEFDFGKKFRITPKAGLLVMFPGWLQHFVHPLDDDSVRISIAYNIKLIKETEKTSTVASQKSKE